VQSLRAVQVPEGKGEALALIRGEELIHVDGVDRLIAGLIATTVAKWLPSSREARQEDVRHRSPSSSEGRLTAQASERHTEAPLRDACSGIVRLIDTHLIASAPLGAVQGAIGLAHQVALLHGILREASHTQADGDVLAL